MQIKLRHIPRQDGISRHSSRGREARSGPSMPDVLRLSEACCVISCLYITASSIRERGAHKLPATGVTKKHGTKTVGFTQPPINHLHLNDVTYSNSSYVTLLLTMALAFRGISDFISRFQSNLPSISLDAAARLARVEAAVSEQSRALEAAQVAAQKSRLRYNLYTAGEF